MSAPDLNYRYLNRDGRWLDFTWDGLGLGSDGGLRPASLPQLTGTLPAGPAPADPSGPAGIADSGDGTIYYSLPDENKVVGVQPCERLAAPRGLAMAGPRRALFICDSGHHRLLAVDPA